MPEGGWLRAGLVGSPHGLDGSFHVRDPVADLLRLGEAVTVRGRELRIERHAGTERRPILRLEGCKERGDAVVLRGEQLLVSRARMPELGPDEWWAEDLEGCAVLDGAVAVGRVIRLLALPSCEVLEVARGEDTAPLLVPLVRDAVRTVDLARGEIDIDLEFLGERPQR